MLVTGAVGFVKNAYRAAIAGGWTRGAWTKQAQHIVRLGVDPQPSKTTRAFIS